MFVEFVGGGLLFHVASSLDVDPDANAADTAGIIYTDGNTPPTGGHVPFGGELRQPERPARIRNGDAANRRSARSLRISPRRMALDRGHGGQHGCNSPHRDRPKPESRERVETRLSPASPRLAETTRGFS